MMHLVFVKLNVFVEEARYQTSLNGFTSRRSVFQNSKDGL